MRRSFSANSKCKNCELKDPLVRNNQYVEFVVNTQASFIDNQALANDYFKFFNELGLLSDYSKSSIEVTKESK